MPMVAGPMLRIVAALGPCDEVALLARAHRGRRDQETLRGSLPDLMSLAMTLALLRPMRLLNVTGRGPACVGELPFSHVHEAIECCHDLVAHDGPSPSRSLRDWVDRQALAVWIVDATAWKRRLGQAESESALLTADTALARCSGRTVAASRHCRLPMGPFEGADGVELILEDGTVAVAAPTTEIQSISLLGARLVPSPPSPHPVWRFEDTHGTRRRVTLAATAGVFVRPSPVFAEETQPAYL
jgi:hypothetical protein